MASQHVPDEEVQGWYPRVTDAGRVATARAASCPTMLTLLCAIDARK